MSAEDDRGALAFAEKLLTLLGEGSFTATYKYAVILGLMDLCLEHSTQNGAAPAKVTTRQLAEKILELYWPHTLPFGRGGVLQQNSGRQARILTRIKTFREGHAADPSASLQKASAAAPAAFERLIRNIEWTLVEMPLPKLQRIGNRVHPFLYEISWDDHIQRRAFNSPAFDNTIRFAGASSEYLVRLSGLLRPLVQREWTQRVARLNSEFVKEPELEDFLFGSDRISLAPVRDDLLDLQSGRCFYCGSRATRSPEIDHFIPWARYPDNGIENLVLTDGRCNQAKRDHLAAAEHVERWVERADKHRDDLADIASRRTWDRHPERSLSVARSLYLGMPEDAQLWREGREFVSVDRGVLLTAFDADTGPEPPVAEVGGLLARLDAYYRDAGIHALDFRCESRPVCAAGCDDFTEAKASLVGSSYGAHELPRLVVLSADPGAGWSGPSERTLEALRTRHSSLKKGIAKGNHWYQTHLLVSSILAEFESGMTPEKSATCFAHVNAAKCSQNKRGKKQADAKLFRNCRRYLREELAILEPDVIVSQGGAARGALGQAIDAVKREMMDECVVAQLGDREIFWLRLHHPKAWGGVYQEQRERWPEFIELIRVWVGDAKR